MSIENVEDVIEHIQINCIENVEVITAYRAFISIGEDSYYKQFIKLYAQFTTEDVNPMEDFFLLSYEIIN